METETAVKTRTTFADVSVATAWTPEALKRISDDFEGRASEDILRWGIDHFGSGIVMATGFGPEGVVLMRLLSQIAPETTIFYLDTDLLFPETYALRDELETRLGLRFERVSTDLSLDAQAEQHGPELWARNPDLCCHLRKVEPLRRYLSTKRAWITAIRRDQTAARAHAGLVEWDRANGLVKLNPLAAWTSDQVWEYIRAHDLPTNPLHQRGYPSIGCWPCTRPVAEGADPRSGRWANFNKTECGIHLQPQPIDTPTDTRYYPVYLNLRDRPCVVIGGGRVAEGKVKGLLDAGARVTVIAPELTPELRTLAAGGRIHHVARAYEPGDLAGAFLVISATDDRAVNRHAWREANRGNIPVNVVDDTPHCNFIAPSIVRRGDLTIAISTGGKAPALAVRLREQLEHSIGDEHARFLQLAGALREPLAARYPDFETRKALWYQLVDSDVIDLLRRGDEHAARQRVAEITGIAPRLETIDEGRKTKD